MDIGEKNFHSNNKETAETPMLIVPARFVDKIAHLAHSDCKKNLDQVYVHKSET